MTDESTTAEAPVSTAPKVRQLWRGLRRDLDQNYLDIMAHAEKQVPYAGSVPSDEKRRRRVKAKAQRSARKASRR